MNPKARKSEIRRQVREQILAMNPLDRSRQETALIQRFEKLPGLESASVVLLYVSAFAEEFETRRILDKVLEAGKQLILPRVDRRSKTLDLFQVTDAGLDLVRGHRGIPEPSANCMRVVPTDVDWVLVPGLAFNSQCYRLGRGAGHYDKLLLQIRPEVQRWALIFNAQWSEDFPIEPHDQSLDGVADHQREIFGNRH